MSLNQKKNWLIAYDIADPRRLNRIHRRMIKHALPVQYSLFLFNGSQRDAQRLLDELAEFMDTREDDLRAYPVPTHPEINFIGQSGLPDNIILHDDDLGSTLRAVMYRNKLF